MVDVTHRSIGKFKGQLVHDRWNRAQRCILLPTFKFERVCFQLSWDRPGRVVKESKIFIFFRNWYFYILLFFNFRKMIWPEIQSLWVGFRYSCIPSLKEPTGTLKLSLCSIGIPPLIFKATRTSSRWKIPSHRYHLACPIRVIWKLIATISPVINLLECSHIASKIIILGVYSNGIKWTVFKTGTFEHKKSNWYWLSSVPSGSQLKFPFGTS